MKVSTTQFTSNGSNIESGPSKYASHMISHKWSSNPKPIGSIKGDKRHFFIIKTAKTSVSCDYPCTVQPV